MLDFVRATQTASNADVEDAQPGVDAIQADESTDPALREDGIASVEKVLHIFSRVLTKMIQGDWTCALLHDF